MKLFRRLDLQLYAIIATVVALWFASFVASVDFWRRERARQLVAIEQERISGRLSTDAGHVLNDILLDHEKAIELTLKHLQRDLALTGIKLERPDGRVTGFGKFDLERPVHAARVETPITFEGKDFGKLVATKLLEEVPFGGVNAAIWLLGGSLVMLLLFWVIRSFIRNRIIVPIQALIASLGSHTNHELSAEITTTSREMSELAGAFSRMKRELQEYQQKVVTSERAQATMEIAGQVAHDIRSPLAALLTVNHDLSELPEAKRVLVRSAIRRIQDIANNLLEGCRARPENVGNSRAEEAVENSLLSVLVDNVVSEKRAQHRARIAVTIGYVLEAESYGVFARVQPREFKRVLANLIQNAVEAFGERAGEVKVRISAEDHAVLTVSDNGRGIPKELLPTLATKGVTHGKKDGNGLGLAHAKATVERWGGRLSIQSTEGVGTDIRIELPRCEEPNWFVPRLNIRPGTEVVVLDDDVSIHHIWKERFAVVTKPGDHIVLRNFSSEAELLSWWAARRGDAESERLFLVDFELIGSRSSGLDIIKKLGISAQSCLVTSRFEEPEVLNGALALGVRVIPKEMVGFVPLSIVTAAESPALDFVLIDDDPLSHLTWSTMATSRGKQGRFFSEPESFFENAASIPQDTPIYVDACLGNKVDGAEVSRRVFERGFQNVFLATGLSKAAFEGRDLSWLKGIVDKLPVFDA